MSNKTLVIGSTGKMGSRILSKLQSQDVHAIPASRSSTTPFDWFDEKTWLAALTGISTVYASFQPDLAIPEAQPIIAAFVKAMREAGVQKIVLLSGRGETGAVACEELVISSGLDFTILRASFFMQNFSEGFWLDGILAREFVIPAINAKEPFLDLDDLSDVAVEVLTTHTHNGKVLELTGPELLSFGQVIGKISGALQSPIGFHEVSVDEYAGMLKEYQVPDEVVELIRYLFTDVLDGRNESIQPGIETILNRKPSSFDQYVQKVMAAGTWTGSITAQI